MTGLFIYNGNDAIDEFEVKKRIAKHVQDVETSTDAQEREAELFKTFSNLPNL